MSHVSVLVFGCQFDSFKTEHPLEITLKFSIIRPEIIKPERKQRVVQIFRSVGSSIGQIHRSIGGERFFSHREKLGAPRRRRPLGKIPRTWSGTLKLKLLLLKVPTKIRSANGHLMECVSEYGCPSPKIRPFYPYFNHFLPLAMNSEGGER